MKAKQIPSLNKTVLIIVTVLLLLIVGIFYHEATHNSNVLPTKSKPAYVDGSDASDQVNNFYRQYISDSGKPEFQKKLVAAYGNQNLVFYNEYYRHGFDPIICSSSPATTVKTTLVSTGPVAIVKATLTYADNSQGTITARVVLSDRLAIDGISCPGAKANLPPSSS